MAEVRADPDADAVQTDGQVSTTVVAGDRVYLGGSFTQVNGVARDNLAAIDRSTGNLTGWAPKTNGPVLALAASRGGERVYAGGDFTRVNGIARGRVAALNASTGGVAKRWKVNANAEVRALTVSRRHVYLGGSFTKVSGKPRKHLAKAGARTGALHRRWAPSTDLSVRTLALSGKRLYLGGYFNTVSGKLRRGLAAVSAGTGALDRAWRPSAGANILDLQVSGGRVYTAQAGGAGQEGAAAYGAKSGATAWRRVSDGDAQAVAVLDGKVYVGGHFGAFAGEPRHGLAALDASTGALDAAWAPSVRSLYPGVLALTPDASQARLYAGGGFTEVSGETRQYFARFSG
jgi:hypothetical protein